MRNPIRRWLPLVGLSLAATLAFAQASPAKKELVTKVLKLQQPGIEAIGRSMLEQSVVQLMQQVNVVVRQRVPQDKREALAKEIQGDIKKFMDESLPVMREQSTKLAPTTIGALLEEKLSEDELRAVVVALESPAFRKYQDLQGEMLRSHSEKLFAGARETVQPKAQALQKAVEQRLAPYVKSNGAPAAGTTPGK